MVVSANECGQKAAAMKATMPRAVTSIPQPCDGELDVVVYKKDIVLQTTTVGLLWSVHMFGRSVKSKT